MLTRSKLLGRIGSKSALRRASDKNNVKYEIPEGKKITQPWNERAEIWKSKFSLFEMKRGRLLGPDIIRLAQTPIDLSPKYLMNWRTRKLDQEEKQDQAFNEDRFAVLGADLSAAHFLVHRGGAIRFFGESNWIRRKEDKTYDLPASYIPGLFVEAIDCSEMNLRQEGVANFLHLDRLRWLNLANNVHIDDWTMDTISGFYGDKLQYLDISNCTKVTHRGLSCFYRFTKLDTLIVHGISDSAEFKLSCMMLEDIRPLVTIKGMEHNVLK